MKWIGTIRILDSARPSHSFDMQGESLDDRFGVELASLLEPSFK
jgi:hypothetical protein